MIVNFFFCYTKFDRFFPKLTFWNAAFVNPKKVNLKPSLSMKILSINNFTTKLLSKLPSDLYIGVHLKGTQKFGSKVINRPFFHRKTVCSSYVYY